MSQYEIPDLAINSAQVLGVELSDAQWQQLAAYLDLLLEHNKQFNLTGIRDPDEAWQRHIVDSLTVLPGLLDLASGDAVVDVGTGGGLPGVVLAIARPDLKITLVDATAKKIRFLDIVRETLDLAGVSTVNARAESLGQDAKYRERFDVAVARAVGPMSQLLEYLLPLVRTGGWALAMKGPTVDAELKSCGDALMKLGAGDVEVIAAYPESFGIDTSIVAVSKQSPTPREYPRPPGIPKQSPL